MLRISYGFPPNGIADVMRTFSDYEYSDLVKNSFAQRVLSEIDGCIISPSGLYDNQYSRVVDPQDISCGSKALILLHSDSEFNNVWSGAFSKNHTKILQEIAATRDVNLYVTTHLAFSNPRCFIAWSTLKNAKYSSYQEYVKERDLAVPITMHKCWVNKHRYDNSSQ